MGSGIGSDFTPEAKARLAVEAISRRKERQEIAADDAARLFRVSPGEAPPAPDPRSAPRETSGSKR